jgi:oligopeptide/dipeptide ABC transporter ATP-binding protein
MAIILITHDLGVIAGVADDVMVMYAGRAMEHAPRRGLFRQPSHPYTAGLLASLPRLNAVSDRLTAIAGQPPSLIRPPSGCPFHPRCPQAMDHCSTQSPPFFAVGGDQNHEAACWLLDREAGNRS